MLFRSKKNLGKPKVFRTSIYDIIEYNFGADTIFSGKAITRQIMEDVANAVGGVYVHKQGSSHIKF